MKKYIDMTSGPIFHQLISFTLPLILGNVFQLTYNMVDSIIVGQFAGSEALAAIGTSDPIMSLIILGVSGMCVGAGVLMSLFFGQNALDKLKEEMKTLTILGIFFSLIVLVIGFGLSKYILILMKSPSSILDMATIYLRVIFLGMPFTVLYNIYASALRSIGNSTTPLKYLMLSSLMNMGLDFILIYFFHMGVLGAGLATVFAEGISAILCVVYTEKNVSYLQINFKDYQLNKELVKQTLSYGGFTALQQATQPIGKLFIQGTVNSLGVTSIAAFNAIGKIEDIGLVPGRSISTSITTFVAQNKGANNKERMEKGFREGILLEIMVGIFISLVLYICRFPLMSLFTSNQEIIFEGASYFSVMFLAYVLSNCSNGHQGYYRGIGYMKTTFFGSVTQISIRAIVSVLIVPFIGIRGIGYACMIGWSCQLVWQAIYRIYVYRKEFV